MSPLSMKTVDLRALEAADLALVEVEPGKWNVVKDRYGPTPEGLDWLARQRLLDLYSTRARVGGYAERVLEKRIPMPNLDLAGSRVASDEHEARTAYPHVCWEHPQLYPGIMVPNWAVALRDACTRVGLSGFGRDLLQHAKRLFPPPDREPERQEKLQQAYEDGADVDALEEKFREQDKEDLERERKALEAVGAAIAVLDLAYQELAPTEPAREALAMKVCDVLEAAGMTYCSPRNDKVPSPAHAHLDRSERIRINLLTARDIERTALLTAARSSRLVPGARWM